MQRLQHDHRGHHIRVHIRPTPTRRDQIREHLIREQQPPMLGQQREHTARLHQMTSKPTPRPAIPADTPNDPAHQNHRQQPRPTCRPPRGIIQGSPSRSSAVCVRRDRAVRRRSLHRWTARRPRPTRSRNPPGPSRHAAPRAMLRSRLGRSDLEADLAGALPDGCCGAEEPGRFGVPRRAPLGVQSEGAIHVDVGGCSRSGDGDCGLWIRQGTQPCLG